MTWFSLSLDVEEKESATRSSLQSSTESSSREKNPVQVISDLAVPADKIPTVVNTGHDQQVRVLDILLTAIQNPLAKSWVKLSPTEIIPPATVRALGQEQAGNVDGKIADLTATTSRPICVRAESWFRVSASSPVDEVRRWVGDAMKASPAPIVIAVMDDSEAVEEKYLGFVCGEDLFLAD